MKHTHYIIYTILSGLLAVLPCHAYEAESDTTATGHYVHQITFDYKPGAILHTNEFLRGGNSEVRTMNHNMSYHLKYAFSAPEQSREARIYRDAYQGVGISYDDFNHQLGSPVSLYLLQGARIASLGSRVSLNYEWNLGLAFGWHPYDPESNPDNHVIGSKVTAYIGLDLYARCILSRHFDVKLGIGAAHYSNGNTQYPNLGLNTAQLSVGATYYINRQADRLLHRHEALPRADHGIVYDLVLFGAWRQRGIYEDGYPYALNGKAAVMGFNFTPMYTLNHWLRLGASLDGIYDRTANLVYDVNAPVNKYDDCYWQRNAAKQMALGVSARVEFSMPYFDINFGVGRNFLNGKNEFGGMYEVLALKMHVTRRAMLHIGYSLKDFHTPRNLMLGVGWRFGRVGQR